MGAENCSPEEMKAAQKAMGPFYLLQFLITFVSTTVLAMFIGSMSDYSPYMTALIVLVGFVIPTQVSGVIWGSTKRALQGKQIFVLVLNQLASLMLAAWILSM